MADEITTSTQSEEATDKVDIVMIPEAGQTETVAPVPGEVVQLAFDVSEQTVILSGDDLQVQFDNGALLIFEDFAKTDAQGNVPMFMMADGSMVPGDVLLLALSGEPIETAAGEAGGDSGGAGEYSDDMGNVLGGISKLGPQDPDALAAAAEPPVEDEQVPIEDLGQDIVIAITDTRDAISEEGGEIDTFTISLSEAMQAGNTVTVDVDFATGTDTEDADFIVAAEAALQAAADATAGVSYSAGTLTFTDAFIGTDLSFSVQAFDDDLTDSPETLTVTLGNATAANGSATVAVTDGSEDVTITDVDAAVTFAIDSTPSISEDGEETATFTVTLGGDPLTAGESASVQIDLSTAAGNAASDGSDYTPAFEAAIIAAAGSTTGVSYDAATNTLTFDSTFAGSFNFTVDAVDDSFVEGTETIVADLSNATVSNGTATISVPSTTTEITEADAAVTFNIAVTSEDLVNDTSTQLARIVEDDNDDDTGTFTISKGGDALTGMNTATVTISIGNTSTASDADFTGITAILAEIQAQAEAAGLTVTNNTTSLDVTWDAADPASFQVDLTAFNDLLEEGLESLTLELSDPVVDNGSATLVNDTATLEIADSEIIFPSGLAYTVAGSKAVNGEQLYSIDLKTGETINVGEILIDGDPLGPNSVFGMELNPFDGYLYAVVNDQPSYHLVMINPATAETVVIDSGSEYKGVTAASFDLAGNYYLAFGNKIYTFDFETETLELLAQGAANQSFSAIAVDPIQEDGITYMYLTVADDLYRVELDPDADIETPVYIGQIKDASSAFTVDGLAFDDNGTLWGLGNEGVIIEIDQDNPFATIVTTISNSDVTGSGAHSLAISIVDPGTYVVLTDGIDTDTTYLPDDGIARAIDPEEDPEPGMWPFANPENTNVEITSDGHGTISVSQDGSQELESVYVQSDNEADITVSNFDNVEVQIRGEGTSSIIIDDALHGLINAGEGDDDIHITNPQAGGEFTIYADGGDDTVALGGDSFDTLVFNASLNEGHDIITGFDLGEDTLSFYEVLDSDIDPANGINDSLDSIQIAVDGADITLTANDGSGTAITLEGVNGSGTFTDYNGHSLGDFLADNPAGINVETHPDTFAS